MEKVVKCLKCKSTDYYITDLSYMHAGKRFMWVKCNKCGADYSYMEEAWKCKKCKTILNIVIGTTYHLKNTEHEIGRCPKCKEEDYRPIAPKVKKEEDVRTRFFEDKIETPIVIPPEPKPDKLFVQRIRLNI
jgi:hypothetical protein